MTLSVLSIAMTEKRARKSHIFSKSELNLSPKSLSIPVINQMEKSLERISPCISGSLSNQEMEGVIDWYKRIYMPSPMHSNNDKIAISEVQAIQG